MCSLDFSLSCDDGEIVKDKQLMVLFILVVGEAKTFAEIVGRE